MLNKIFNADVKISLENLVKTLILRIATKIVISVNNKVKELFYKSETIIILFLKYWNSYRLLKFILQKNN